MSRLGWLAAAAVLAVPACAVQAGTHVVVIEGMAYQPAAITVKPGDTIVWRNRDLVPHTVTGAAQHVESGDIGVGKSWTYRRAAGHDRLRMPLSPDDARDDRREEVGRLIALRRSRC